MTSHDTQAIQDLADDVAITLLTEGACVGGRLELLAHPDSNPVKVWRYTEMREVFAGVIAEFLHERERED